MNSGITLKPGTHVGVPSSWIQRSTAYYEDPDTFDGYRFVKRAAAGEPNTKLVDLSPSYLVFGMGVHAWYVFFYSRYNHDCYMFRPWIFVKYLPFRYQPGILN